MNRRKTAAVLLPFAAAAVLAGCGGKTSETETSSYVYTPVQETTLSPDSVDYEKEIYINNSWTGNFRLSYEYFNSENGSETSLITETKSASAFSADYNGGETVLYYKENGGDIDYYVIVRGEKKQTHSVLQGKSIKKLSSTFMKLSSVDDSLPSLPNVMFMEEEEIAGRTCRKYVQRAYQDSELTSTVYIWIDSEYGFAAKCVQLDKNDKAVVSWELKSFASGEIADDDNSVDLSAYEFSEE